MQLRVSSHIVVKYGGAMRNMYIRLLLIIYGLQGEHSSVKGTHKEKQYVADEEMVRKVLCSWHIL